MMAKFGVNAQIANEIDRCLLQQDSFVLSVPVLLRFFIIFLNETFFSLAQNLVNCLQEILWWHLSKHLSEFTGTIAKI